MDQAKSKARNLFILRAHFTGHKNWRIIQQGLNIPAMMAELARTKKISDWEIVQMDGLTGEFKIVEKSK